MNVNSQTWQQMAWGLGRFQLSFSFKTRPLANGHLAILEKIYQLKQYCYRCAYAYEQLEQELAHEESPYFHTSGQTSFYMNPTNLIRKGLLNLSAHASGSLNVVEYKQEGQWGQASLALGHLGAKASGQVQLFKQGQFDPALDIQAELEASVLETKLETHVGQHLSAQAKGDIGVVYGQAKCHIAKDEVHLDVGVGAAAARGEIRCAINLFGFKITLSTGASIGSAEWQATYRQSNKEWEVGAKIGFIAGVNFNVKVERE